MGNKSIPQNKGPVAQNNRLVPSDRERREKKIQAIITKSEKSFGKDGLYIGTE